VEVRGRSRPARHRPIVLDQDRILVVRRRELRYENESSLSAIRSKRLTSRRGRTCSSQIGSTIKSQTTTEAGFQNQFSYDDYVRRGQVTHHRAHRDHPLRPNPNTRLQYHRVTTTPKPETNQPRASSYLQNHFPPLFPLIPSFPTRTSSKPRNLENLATHHTSAQAGNSTPRPPRVRTTDREDRTSSYPVGPCAGRQASLRVVCSPGWRLGCGGRGG
jgi:hypothetical protein